MNCPACKTEALSACHLDDDLPAYSCAKCTGNWLSAEQYLDWVKRRENLPEKPYEGPELTITDQQRARLCPQCRAVMLRYQVGHGTDVILDRCGSCNGVWFDRNEWQALKGRNLHDEVHEIFTAPWQDAVRREESRRNLDLIYRQRFGEDYDEVTRIREWLDGHPERLHILAFLSDKDPYST